MLDCGTVAENMDSRRRRYRLVLWSPYRYYTKLILLRSILT